jgi:NitT/TauT family transport system permease protein
VAVLGVWQWLSAAHAINPLIVSSPTRIAAAAKQMISDGTLGSAAVSSLKLFAIAMALSIVSGLAIGAVIGWYPRANAIVDPWVSILYAVPRIALIPIVAVWTGIGFESQVIVVWLTAVFPVIINTQSGIAAIDRDLFEVARSFRASSWQVLRTIAIPGAVPTIVAGVRQGMMQGLIGVVVAEYFFGNTGIGGLIFTAGTALQTANALVGAVIFAIAALVLTAALRRAERRLDKWRA